MGFQAAEQDRLQRIALLGDDEALRILIDSDDISEREEEAFKEMQEALARGRLSRLTFSQRAWVQDALKRVVPLDSTLVPRGKPVVTPEVLRNLPKRPPGRK
jgi:hypothetical protein